MTAGASGVFRLPREVLFGEPLIAITNEEVTHFSPLHLRHAPGPEVFIAYGDTETLPFAQQARDFSLALSQQGAASSVTELASTNHMSAVRDMGNSGSVAGQLLGAAISSRPLTSKRVMTN